MWASSDGGRACTRAMPLPRDERPPVCDETCASDAIQAASTLAARRVPAAPRPNLTPVAPQRFALQVTLDQATYEELRYGAG